MAVTFKFGPTSYGMYNSENQFVIEPGKFTLFVGNSSENTLVQREGKCISFQKQIPLHTFWIQRLKEKVEMLEGKGEGQELEVEGETVYPIYRFDKRCLKVEIDNENLTLFWSTMSNRIPIRYID